MTGHIGLEIWLTGTPTELDTAAHALARLGRIAYHSSRHRLHGADTGRYRVYVRIHIAVAARPALASTPAAGGAVLMDLDTAHRPAA